MNTILAIFTILSAIATIIYAIIAFRTLLEIKAQREASYRPDLIIDENTFYIYSQENPNGCFPIEYTYERKSENYKSTLDLINGFGINLYNIGLGSAKEISVEYSFDLDTVISKINQLNSILPIEKIIRIEKNNNSLGFHPPKNFHRGLSIHSISLQLKRKVNHLLPVNISSTPLQLTLPAYVLELYSTLLYTVWLDMEKHGDFLELPIINMKIQYRDIGNRIHSKIFDISIDWYAGTPYESCNSFSVKESLGT